MPITHVAVNSDVDKVSELIEEEGAVIVDDFLTNTLHEALLDDLAPYLTEIPLGCDDFSGFKTRRVGRLFARSPHMQQVALHPLYLGVSRNIIQKPINVWFGESKTEITPEMRIGLSQAIQIMPGEGRQPLHRDDTVFLWRHPQYGREARVQIMIALTDFCEENGGTRVIPGSNQWDDERMPRQDESIPVEMKAGSALIWVGSVYHGGGQNNSRAPRLGLTMAYDLGSLRQEENQYLSVPTDIIRAMPEDLQQLMGWTAGKNIMGWVEVDGRMTDPAEFLANDEFKVVNPY